MKTKLLLLVAFIFGSTLQAQTYDFTLIQNSAYNFSVAAVPNFTSATPFRSDQNFTILLPDGITISGVTGGYTVPLFTAIDAYAAGQDAIAFNLVQDIATPSTTGTPIILTSFDVDSSPITGQISLIGNSHPLVLASPPTFGSRFLGPLSGDLGDPNTENYGAQTGTTTYLFAPLSTNDVELVSNKFSLYPNPSSDNFSVAGLKAEANVSIYSVSGKKVLSVEDYTGDAINVSALTSGLYLVSIESEASKEVKRLVIK